MLCCSSKNSGNVGNQDGVSLRRFQARSRETERAVIFLFMVLLFGRIAGQGDRLQPVIRADLDFKRLRFAQNAHAGDMPERIKARARNTWSALRIIGPFSRIYGLKSTAQNKGRQKPPFVKENGKIIRL